MQTIKVANTYRGEDGHLYFVFSQCKDGGSYAVVRVNADAWRCVAHGVNLDENGVLQWDSYTNGGFLDQNRRGIPRWQN